MLKLYDSINNIETTLCFSISELQRFCIYLHDNIKLKNMKRIIFTFTLLFVLVIAQGQDSMKLNRSLKKMQKKAVSVEITDVSGEQHSGFLWNADSVSVVMSESMFKDSNLLKINFTDIYRLKLYKKQSYGQSFTRNFIITGGLTYAISAFLVYSTDDSMIGPGIIALFLYTAGGLPANLLISASDMKVIDIDFVSKIEKPEDFIIDKRFFEKNSLSKTSSLNLETIEIGEYQPNIVNSIQPKARKHPRAVSLFHLSGAFNMSRNTLHEQYLSILAASDFSDYLYPVPENSYFFAGWQYKFGISATRNIRPL